MKIKQCPICNKILPLSRFRKRYGELKKYRQSYCRECEHKENIPYMKIYLKDYRKRIKYDISQKDFIEMLLKQNGKCIICNTSITEKTANIDHNHKSGVIRDLLCRKCNLGLGLFLEDISILKSAILYLRKWDGRDERIIIKGIKI